MSRFITTFIFYLMLTPVSGQTDTLFNQSYEKLIEYYVNDTSFEQRQIFTRAIIQKSKIDQDTTWLFSGYQIMAKLHNDINVLKYCDSIILYAKNRNDKYYPATAYLMKGVYYYNKRDFQKALNEYLIAKEYATGRQNPYLVQKINYSIGILKDRIGESEEALKIHKENFIYTRDNFQSVDKPDYLLSIFALASTFNDLKVIDSASYYNHLGIKESQRLNDNRRYNHFVLNTGVTLFYQGKYSAALDSLTKGTQYFEKIGNLPNMAVGYFYAGKTYAKLEKTDTAMQYFQKVDTIFQKNHDLLPVLRESYEYLINYAKQQNDLEQQLVYIKQLIKLDSVLYNNKIHLSANIVKQYDIPKLLSAKENIIQSLEKKEAKFRKAILVVAICLLLMTVLFYFQYRKRKLYKKRFDRLYNNEKINLSNPVKNTDGKQPAKKKLQLPEDVVENILSGLDRFEKNRDFLDKNLTIHILAKQLGTNANYLSKVVNVCKGQSFVNYVNQLRVTYAIEELKANPEQYRKYTIKAIAKEFGFKTGESFSLSFHKNTGIRLSYFIKELPNQDIDEK